jgi:hypothetical protein
MSVGTALCYIALVARCCSDPHVHGISGGWVVIRNDRGRACSTVPRVALSLSLSFSGCCARARGPIFYLLGRRIRRPPKPPAR